MPSGVTAPGKTLPRLDVPMSGLTCSVGSADALARVAGPVAVDRSVRGAGGAGVGAPGTGSPWAGEAGVVGVWPAAGGVVAAGAVPGAGAEPAAGAEPGAGVELVAVGEADTGAAAAGV